MASCGQATSSTRLLLEPTVLAAQRGKRTIPLPGQLVTALEDHRPRQAKGAGGGRVALRDSGCVFTTPIGTPVDPRNDFREFRKPARPTTTTRRGRGGPGDDRGCCSRCCPACPRGAEVAARSGFDLGVYGCAA